jgi:hypothetical protein
MARCVSSSALTPPLMAGVVRLLHRNGGPITPVFGLGFITGLGLFGLVVHGPDHLSGTAPPIEPSQQNRAQAADRPEAWRDNTTAGTPRDAYDGGFVLPAVIDL